MKALDFILFFFFSSILFSEAQEKRNQQRPDLRTRRMLLRDEGLSQLSYVDLSNPTGNWYASVPSGRDLQLIGNGRVLIGTGTGFEEREITTGKKVFELNSYTGTVAARRLRNPCGRSASSTRPG